MTDAWRASLDAVASAHLPPKLKHAVRISRLFLDTPWLAKCLACDYSVGEIFGCDPSLHADGAYGLIPGVSMGVLKIKLADISRERVLFVAPSSGAKLVTQRWQLECAGHMPPVWEVAAMHASLSAAFPSEPNAVASTNVRRTAKAPLQQSKS
jgi:hypothetical protein